MYSLFDDPLAMCDFTMDMHFAEDCHHPFLSYAQGLPSLPEDNIHMEMEKVPTELQPAKLPPELKHDNTPLENAFQEPFAGCTQASHVCVDHVDLETLADYFPAFYGYVAETAEIAVRGKDDAKPADEPPDLLDEPNWETFTKVNSHEAVVLRLPVLIPGNSHNHTPNYINGHVSLPFYYDNNQILQATMPAVPDATFQVFLDNGASHSIIPERVFRKYFQHTSKTLPSV